MMKINVGKFIQLSALLLISVMGLGCTAAAQLSVLRPAMLNARQYGGTVTVGPFDGHPIAAVATQEELRQIIVNAEGQPLALLEAGGALFVHGAVIDYSYMEDMDSSNATCPRTITDQNGQSTTIQVPCVHYTRRGRAHVAIAFNITHTPSGQTIYSSTVEDSSSATRTATDQIPAGINGEGMLYELRASLTQQFSRIIVPWRETVRVSFGRCGDARTFCDEGISAVRQGGFPQAIASFQEAARFLEGQPEPNPRHVAEAYWNLGLAQEYSGDYAGAIQSILRAAELNPENANFAPELQNVQRMAQEAQQLQEQGVAP